MTAPMLSQRDARQSSSFGRFASVGVIGWIVQLAVFLALKSVGVPYMVAIAAAVGFAILHNFVWHELYTWQRARSNSAAAIALRLARFNTSTALISILGNLVLTAVMVELFHIPPVVANTFAVLTLSLLNYRVVNRWVFARLDEVGR
jgi:putative flippase GtrA